MKEKWKTIKEHPLYSVSNMGNIRNDVTGKMLKPFKIGTKDNQYYAVDFYPVKNVRVHRLVASAFVPNYGGKPEVNHIDGDHFNNAAENLEWVTGSENCLHSHRVLGHRRLYGSENPAARKVERVEDGAIFGSIQEAAVAVGLKSHASISKAIKRLRNTAGGFHWKYAEREPTK